MKLTDTQLVPLSAAAQRQDGAIELGPKLKGSASRKVVGRLLSEGLIEEIPAQGSLPEWRREDKGAVGLRITERGLAAIGAGQGAEAGAAEARPRAKGQSGPAPRRATAPRKRTGEAPRRPAKAGRAESKQAAVIAMLQGRQGARPTLDHGDAPARHHVRSAEYRGRRSSGNLETSR